MLKQGNLPKHIPHNPVKTVSKITKIKLPFKVRLKTAKANTNTSTVCPNITVNCVITCANNNSVPVIPLTNERSKIPSFLSSNIAPDVKATAKKNIILKQKRTIKGMLAHFLNSLR